MFKIVLKYYYIKKYYAAINKIAILLYKNTLKHRNTKIHKGKKLQMKFKALTKHYIRNLVDFFYNSYKI